MLNDEKIYQSQVDPNSVIYNDSGYKYYEDAYNFRDRLINTYGLDDLNSNEAVDASGNQINSEYFTKNVAIFEELDNLSGTYIEDDNSNFNMHKKEVIRNSIETNLMAAISNYNKVSSSQANFSMPRLEDYEWELISNNISMITFMQGLNIGGKIYNGHAIVQNDANEDLVSEESVYILYNGQYYRPQDPILVQDSTNLNDAIGLVNIDFERRTALASYKSDIEDVEVSKNIYYYPRIDLAAYSSVIDLNDDGTTKSVYEYFSGSDVSPRN